MDHVTLLFPEIQALGTVNRLHFRGINSSFLDRLADRTPCRRILLVIALISLHISVFAQSLATNTDGNFHYYERLMALPTKTLLNMGNDYRQRRLMPDSAFICYSMAAERLKQNDLAAEERDCAIERLGKHIIGVFE